MASTVLLWKLQIAFCIFSVKVLLDVLTSEQRKAQEAIVEQYSLAETSLLFLPQ